MKHEVTVSPNTVRGLKKWRVRWYEAGRVKRASFGSREVADSKAAELRGDATSVRKWAAGLEQTRLEKLRLVDMEAERRGVDIMALLTLLQSAKDKPAAGPTLNAAIDELVLVWTKAGRNARYIEQLAWNLKSFAKQSPGMSISNVTLREVEQFLNTKQLVSRGDFRGRLSILFNFAVRRGYLVSNPCTRLERITVTRPAPHFLTVDETRKALAWLSENPRANKTRALGWFVLSTFAGLRPEEADKTTWKDVNLEEGWIKVEAQTTKTRQRRVVYPQKLALDWLREVKTLNLPLEISNEGRKWICKQLLPVLGWPTISKKSKGGWKKDVTRHSCGTYWTTQSGDTKTVAHALGHSESILLKNYRGLSTRVEAEKFWALRPDTITKPKKLPKKKPLQLCNSTPNTPSMSAPTPSTEPSTSSPLTTPKTTETSTSSICNSTIPTPTTPTPPNTGS